MYCRSLYARLQKTCHVSTDTFFHVADVRPAEQQSASLTLVAPAEDFHPRCLLLRQELGQETSAIICADHQVSRDLKKMRRGPTNDRIRCPIKCPLCHVRAVGPAGILSAEAWGVSWVRAEYNITDHAICIKYQHDIFYISANRGVSHHPTPTKSFCLHH